MDEQFGHRKRAAKYSAGRGEIWDNLVLQAPANWKVEGRLVLWMFLSINVIGLSSCSGLGQVKHPPSWGGGF